MIALFSISEDIAVSVLFAFSSALSGLHLTATLIWLAELPPELEDAADAAVLGIADMDADLWTLDLVPAFAKVSRVDAVREMDAAGVGEYPSLSAIFLANPYRYEVSDRV